MGRVRKSLCSHPFVRKRLLETPSRTSTLLAASCALNSLYAVWQIACGIGGHSFWFVTLGCYYALLALAGLVLLRQAHDRSKRVAARWKSCRICGMLLLSLNVVLSGMVVLAVTGNLEVHDAGSLIYAMATYTFCQTGLATRNLVKHRASRDPILAASKTICFVSAAASVLSLEMAMVLHFGNDWAFFQTMTALTGAGVCLALSAASIRLIVLTRNDGAGSLSRFHASHRAP